MEYILARIRNGILIAWKSLHFNTNLQMATILSGNPNSICHSYIFSSPANKWGKSLASQWEISDPHLRVNRYVFVYLARIHQTKIKGFLLYFFVYKLSYN